ncbi:MAG: hypothetical protein K2G64_05895 [Muribaculaceae bacterium]|nr:hypothetical protein [Muribaculaceae bacterium]
MPMLETSTPHKSNIKSVALTTSNIGPRRATIEALRRFARAYVGDCRLPIGLRGLSLN